MRHHVECYKFSDIRKELIAPSKDLKGVLKNKEHGNSKQTIGSQAALPAFLLIPH
jgi:hypothetical protein